MSINNFWKNTGYRLMRSIFHNQIQPLRGCDLYFLFFRGFHPRLQELSPFRANICREAAKSQ